MRSTNAVLLCCIIKFSCVISQDGHSIGTHLIVCFTDRQGFLRYCQRIAAITNIISPVVYLLLAFNNCGLEI